mmetsp:Transcript_68855/g.108614  ORF Transcript_68855/g.108614 Transcript_68855/m.108614 type:complete len:120 (-) Transcript_68855:87-446(-)
MISHLLAAVFFVWLIPTLGAEGTAVPACEFSGREQRFGDDSPVLLVSFMLLRAAVALRSLWEGSETIMWQGIAFACFSRCIVKVSPDSGDAASLLLSGLREFLHVYGLRMVLRQLSLSC